MHFSPGKPDVAIIRGTWFTEEKDVYQPLPEEDADVIEKEHTSRELQGKIVVHDEKTNYRNILN